MGMDICLLANEIDGIFTLPCALCADHIILPEVIHTLAAVDRMVICGSQGRVGHSRPRSAGRCGQ